MAEEIVTVEPTRQAQVQQPMQGIPQVSVDMSLNPDNVAAELAKRAAAAQVQQPTEVVNVEVPQPLPAETPVNETVATPVPEKFKTPDGQVDAAKVEKSALNVEQALQEYLKKEKELKQKINEVNRLQTQVPMPQQVQDMTLAERLNADLAANPQNPGAVLARLVEAMRASVAAELRQETQVLAERQEQTQRQSELKDLIQNDPFLLSPEGINALNEIRATTPWVNASPEPYKAAYEVYLGRLAKAQRNGLQVQMPTPTVRAAQPPVAPVQAVSRPTLQPAINFDGRYGDVREQIVKMSPEQRDAYYKSLGLPTIKYR